MFSPFQPCFARCKRYYELYVSQVISYRSYKAKSSRTDRTPNGNGNGHLGSTATYIILACFAVPNRGIPSTQRRHQHGDYCPTGNVFLSSGNPFHCHFPQSDKNGTYFGCTRIHLSLRLLRGRMRKILCLSRDARRPPAHTYEADSIYLQALSEKLQVAIQFIVPSQGEA